MLDLCAFILCDWLYWIKCHFDEVLWMRFKRTLSCTALPVIKLQWVLAGRSLWPWIGIIIRILKVVWQTMHSGLSSSMGQPDPTIKNSSRRGCPFQHLHALATQHKISPCIPSSLPLRIPLFMTVVWEIWVTEEKGERNICDCSKRRSEARVSSLSMENRSAVRRGVENMWFLIRFTELFPAIADSEGRKSSWLKQILRD